ncbi:cbb3-type cytochrome c oxidase subunit II, partial [Campylobacter jejuni]|nr:cbb3-type cytochrome c oxidase subunit II [Campylobacter jejuni]
MFSWLEKNPFFFAVAVFVVIAYAGIVEVLPNFAENARPIEGKNL